MSKNDIKETEEKEQVEKFFKAQIGQKWVEELGIVDCIKSESPDFVLKTKNGESIALELTNFIAENKNLKFSQALTTIGNKICREAEKEYNLHMHILINKYDNREFSIHWKDHLDYAYNPGFSQLPDAKKLKQKLQNILKNIFQLVVCILMHATTVGTPCKIICPETILLFLIVSIL